MEETELVLFVDDEQNNLDLYEALMQGQGIRFHTTTNPLEALERMRTHPVTLVIADNHMPIMTGVEFIPKAQAIKPKAKFFMVTAAPPSGNESPLPREQIISKPFDVMAMRRLVAQHAF